MIWTEAQKDWLRANYQTLTIWELSRYLGKSKNAVQIEAHRLDLYRGKTDFYGCDEDCEHCIYPDCYKPYRDF